MDFYKKQLDIIKQYNTKIKESSITTYLNSIKKICKELFKSDTCSLMYFKDHQSVIEYLDEIKSISTRKNTCTAIIVLLKANSGSLNSGSSLNFIDTLIPIYSDYHKKLAEKQNDFYLDNEKSEKETDNWITQKEIKDKIKELEKKFDIGNSGSFSGTPRKYIDTFQMFLVLNLYTQLPPVRNDFALTKVIHEQNLDTNTLNLDTNYINFKTKTEAELLLCNYKTAKTYGIKVIPLPEQLTQLIFKFQVAKKKIFHRDFDYLLINTTNLDPMSKNSLTKYINKIFAPKKVSTTLIRKCYLSEKYPVIHTNRERENDSYVMGHGIGMAQGVYTKRL
jgi:hypothetical protein